MHQSRGIWLAALAWGCFHVTTALGREEPGVIIGHIDVAAGDGATRTPGKDAITLTQRGTLRAAHSPALPDSLSGQLVAIYPVDGCGPLHAVDSDGIVRPLLEMLGAARATVAIMSAQNGSCSISDRISAVHAALGDRAKAVLLYGSTDANKIGTEAADVSLKLPTLVVDSDAGAVVLSRLRAAGKRSEQLVLSLFIPPEVRAAAQSAAEHPTASGAEGSTMSALQTTLVVVVLLLLLAFGTSLYMQYHIRQLEEQLARQRLADARGAVPMDESLLSRLEIVEYARTPDPAAGVGDTCSPLSDEGLVQGDRRPCSPMRSDSGGDICPICLEDLVDGVVLNKLPCGHVFHPACIQHWLRTRSTCCPMCKADVRDAFLEADRLAPPAKEPRVPLIWRLFPCIRSRPTDRQEASHPVLPPVVSTPHHSEHATYPGRYASGAFNSLDHVSLDQTHSQADISRIL